MLAFFAAVALPLRAQDSIDGLFDNVMDIDMAGGRSFGDGFTEYGENEGASFSDDIDSLFEDAEDVSTQEAQARNEAEKPAPTVATGGASSILAGKSPVTFTGKLTGEVGLGYAHHPTSGSGFSGYFDFENYLTFKASASDKFSVTGQFLTEFPDFSFELYQMYFDYRLFNTVYLSGGKRQYKWGYVRLFDDDDEYETSTGAANTGRFQPNILYDSRKHISARLIVPVSIFSFTGVAMYPLSTTSSVSGGDPVSPSAMSFAGSAEARIKRVTVNLFGRKFPSGGESSILGAEAKTTFFGVDLYVHTQMRIASAKNAITFKRSGFGAMNTIAGIMRVWDKIRPVIALNFEYQNTWNVQTSALTNRIAFVGAVSKIGPGDHVTIGVEWNHNITECSGDVTPGIIVSGFLPHARWKTAAEIYYGEDSSGNKISSPQVNFGSTIYLEMSY